jgi:hypothetical protein
MNELTIFTPINNLSAQENLDAFILHAKERIKVFGADLDFDSNSWDVTDFVDIKGSKNQENYVFSDFKSRSITDRKDVEFFKEPYLSFAKAYMRYMHGFRPTKAGSSRLITLRVVYESLSEYGSVNPIFINQDIANRACQLIVENYSAGLAYRLGSQLEMMIEYAAENRLLNNSFQWHSSIKRPNDTQRIGEEADKRRAEKLPSQAALDALPQIFRMATRDIHSIVSATTAILLSSPDRINEVLRLDIGCEVIRKNSDGTELYGLRWRGSKGAQSHIKDIVSSMVDVVKEALGKIRRETEKARVVAKWYEDNPTKMYLAPGTEHYRDQELLSTREASDILFGEYKKRSAKEFLCGTKKINGVTFVEFKALEKWVLSQLPRGFPFLDKETGLKYSEALYVSLRNQFRSTKATYTCVIDSIGTNKINSYLGGRDMSGLVSIFQAFGFTEPNGDPITVTTHQFRHYLNTLALAGGMSEIQVSKWSGRKDVKQTAAYDHRTSSEVVQQIRDAMGHPNKAYGPIAKFGQSNLIKRDEISKLVVETAHTTDIGYCLHNFVSSPCQLHRDCINCQEMVCIKGDKKAQENLRMRLEESNNLLKLTQEASENEYHGADRWLSHQLEVNERYKQLVDILENPQIPNGTVIQLSKPKTLIEQDKLKLRGKNGKK